MTVMSSIMTGVVVFVKFKEAGNALRFPTNSLLAN